MSWGYTLIEAVIAIALLTLIAGSAAPTATKLRERAAVRTTREALVGLIAEARGLAVARGGATVHVLREPPSASITVEGAIVRSLRSGVPTGVSFDLGSGRDSIHLRYDDLGVGRVASATILVRSGTASAALVISSYGRVRRQ